MTLTQTLAELKSLGSEQTAKTYRRHGVTGEIFGVKFGDLGKLAKRIKTNHALAVELWHTTNADAHLLATMIADPARFTVEDLHAWLAAAPHHTLIDLFAANIAAKTPHAPGLAALWSANPDERIGRAGWQLVSHLAMQSNPLPDDFFRPYLETIAREIHTRPNRTREAMNQALICIGVRSAALEPAAMAVAKQIGKVEVDHGDTSCKTPDAAAYIQRTLAHRKSKARTAHAG